MSKSSSSIAKQSNFLNSDWYKPLVTEISETIKMAVIDSRTRLVEGYWSAGKLIRLSAEGINVTALLQRLAVDTKVAERELWYCLEAYDTFPEFGQIPEGNNISWNKLKTKYLSSPKEETECIHEWIEICRKCRKLKETLNHGS